MQKKENIYLFKIHHELIDRLRATTLWNSEIIYRYITHRNCSDDKTIACGISLEYKEVKKKFPSLTREIELETSKVRINSYRSDMGTGEAATVSGHNLTGYTPDVIDYIRRCDTETQAKEIIAFLKKQGEISSQYADRLMEQLLKHGVRSFGSKKCPGFYEKLRTQ